MTLLMGGQKEEVAIRWLMTDLNDNWHSESQLLPYFDHLIAMSIPKGARNLQGIDKMTGTDYIQKT
jgi:hypothetical protein